MYRAVGQPWSLRLFLCASFLFPMVFSLSLLQKAAMLEPSLYILRLAIKSNMVKLHFTYYLSNEVHLNLYDELDTLVLETRANFVYEPLVFLNHTLQLDVDDFQEGEFYYLSMKNGSLFYPGHYTVFTRVLGQITEKTMGIKYVLHRDRKAKRWTYSVLLDFQPNFAKYVMVSLHDVNTPCQIDIMVITELGFHVYFIRQPVSQTVIDAPPMPDVEIIDVLRQRAPASLHVLKRDTTKVSNSTMYSMTMPLSMIVIYISENVRMTVGSQNFSATVTAERNQIGGFSEDFKYVLDLFYKYVKAYRTFGPRKLPLKFEDVVLHLRQNVSEIGDTSHTHCTVSILFVLQSHRSVAMLNSFMARCIAANHIMPRRYPKYWDSYYILMGLREYYALFMRLPGGGVAKDHDFSGIGLLQIRSFEYDDREADQPVLGGYYSDADVYWYMNILRALSLMHMLKHLIVGSKGFVFNEIVAEFLSDSRLMYDRDSFTDIFQNVTKNKVFRTKKRIDEFFDSWSLQYGYPIVDAVREGRVVHVTQMVCPVSQNANPNQTFILPINVVAETMAFYEINKTEPSLWLVPPQQSITFEVPGLSKWFVINNQRASYYRVRYDVWNYKLLRFELLRGDLRKFSPVTRGQILDDVLFFAKIGARVAYDTTFEMIEYLRRETDEMPWAMASYELNQLAHLLRFTPAYPYFKIFMKICARQFYRRGVEQASRTSKYALEWACFGELKACKRFTYSAFQKIVLQRESYEHLFEIICNGVRSSDKATFRYIKLALLNRLETMDIELYFKALSCLDNYSQLKESLNMIFRRTSALGATMTKADKERVVTGMCENSEEGCQAILDFTFQQPKLVYRSLGEAKFKTVMSYLTKSIYKRAHQRRLRMVLMYLNITDTEVIWAGIQSKRAWLLDNLTFVARWLREFARDRKSEIHDSYE